MQIEFVDLKRQHQSIKQDVLREISKVLDDMQLFLGPNTLALDEEFARYCGADFGIGVGSGTEALHLALRACGVGQGDEVITVANTFFATVEAIAAVGARPVFVDINSRSFNMDESQIEAKITAKTRAIIPVHLYGQPANMDPILELARLYDLKVIEDACQAHGAKYKGRSVGTLGDAGCFSFYCAKNLGAYGEAGMIVTADPDVARKCLMLRNHGQDVRYYHPLLGVNGRIDEIQAAVLRVKLPYLDSWNNGRRAKAQRYRDGLPPSVVVPEEMDWGTHVYHLFVIRTEQRDKLQEYLRSRGVATGIHYPVPIHQQEACRRYHDAEVSLPVTDEVTRQILSLPMYPELREQEIDYVCSCVSDFCRL